MSRNRSLVLASVVILVALLALKDQAAAMPRVIAWAGPDSISVAYLAHMATLELRRVSAAVASVITIR